MGRVTDGDGTPLAGVTVRAATGIGTLSGGSSTFTDADGRYDLRFGMGIMFGDIADQKPSPQTQYALLSARLAGHFERNFNRQGIGIASLAPVDADVAKKFGVEPNQVCLPEKPREVNFVMLAAARVSGILLDEDDQPLNDFSVSLTGGSLSPGSSVLAQVRTDDHGRFEITEIPTTVPFQFRVRKPRSQLKPPWDDSWASGPLTFANPGDNDLATSLSSEPAEAKLIRVKSLKLKVVGPGVHGNAALARAAKQKAVTPEALAQPIAGALSMDELTLELINE